MTVLEWLLVGQRVKDKSEKLFPRLPNTTMRAKAKNIVSQSSSRRIIYEQEW
eukprot:CAMPEP_0201986164 /NCGR_PEP_ID=MMETSP0904-20121228/89589_1 /ASSEMBLY_ACC=CAM_ASM_000553 /TAXON_ID=420261 /ORGANISM="Thalassiosira antarctica, Strain CCMP982" /LENGTH=51 /DNA_ID=CAMNT_0048540053 /DNA_START=318 /DNA_END=470 /DNA_ORIENTATION=+